MKLESFISIISGVNDYNEAIAYSYLRINANVDMSEMQDLLQQGIMTQADIDIIISDHSVIIADIEDIVNNGHDHGLSKREIVKRLMGCLIREHKLSAKYVQHIIKQLDKYL